MRLRKTIRLPSRYEDEDPLPAKSRNGTKPTYPALLQEQVVAFNPNHLPAAFPSLPLIDRPPQNYGDAQYGSETPSNDTPSWQEGLGSISCVNESTPQVSPTEEEQLTSESQASCNITPQHGAVNSIDTSANTHSLKQVTISGQATDLEDSEQTTLSNRHVVSGLEALHPDADGMHANKFQEEPGITWNSLPLSLQYRIYTALTASFPTRSLRQILSLTDQELTDIQKAVRLRILHPASLAEIWEHAGHATAEVPGILGSHPLDVQTFNNFSDYMIFASNYESAFESEIRNARDFLSSRAIPPELLGTWLPDPSEPHGSSYFVYIPGIDPTRVTPSHDIHIDSGYSSLSEAEIDRAASRQTMTHKSANTRVPFGRSINRRARARPSKGRPRTLAGKDPTSERHSIAPGGSVPAKPARHPLTIVTKPGESPGKSKDAEDEERNFGSLPPMARVPLQTAADAQSAAGEGPVDGSESNSPFETPFTNVEHAENIQGASEDSSAEPTATSQLNPSRLVLRIENKDGFARVLKKRPKSNESVSPIASLPPGIPPNSPILDMQHMSQPAVTVLTKLDTSMSSFSRGLIIDSATSGASVVKGRDPRDCLALRESLSVRDTLRLSPIPPHKRKASKEVVRPSPTKMQRTVEENSETPSSSITSEDIDNEQLCHTEARSSWNLGPVRTRESSDISTPSKITRPASDHQGKRREPLRSPSYSPIPENEDLEEFQALLRGPAKKNSRIKAPGPNTQVAMSHPMSSTSTSPFIMQIQRGLTVNSPTGIRHSENDVGNTRTSTILPGMTTSNTGGYMPHMSVETPEMNNPQKPRIKLVLKGLKDTSKATENVSQGEQQAAVSNAADTDIEDVDGDKRTKPGAEVDTDRGAGDRVPSKRLSQSRKETTKQTGNPSKVAAKVTAKTTLKATPRTSSRLAPKAIPEPISKATADKSMKDDRAQSVSGTPEGTPQSKPRGPPRGHRGPYRKTRERIAREEQERQAQQLEIEQTQHPEAIPQEDTTLQAEGKLEKERTQPSRKKKQQSKM
ncbi:hypothetical protein LTR47_007296 [Exophiala xenobiotica]|nr:hypothetical protein LTR47_007296 [Exophiala xenobiotica]KAK5254025.1 hypothetical protein LTS06_001512 [Exophiala xenobiotica]KAK5351985.1 hypothetical protein LTR61_004235 [Exophiala xenobiotica]KAK5371487.1 hypothetical protein LTR11_006514 [Exophiala xenobiotica]KAK5380913.1 hypothetical protein LTS03_003752 [Exophiala xenobiotica]